MNAKKARALRRLATEEMAEDKVPARDLVWGSRSVVNSPQSERALYLKLKQAYLRPEPKRDSSANKQKNNCN